MKYEIGSIWKNKKGDWFYEISEINGHTLFLKVLQRPSGYTQPQKGDDLIGWTRVSFGNQCRRVTKLEQALK